jgi:hypothetical protein
MNVNRSPASAIPAVAVTHRLKKEKKRARLGDASR